MEGLIIGLVTVVLFWTACAELLKDQLNIEIKNTLIIIGVFFIYSNAYGPEMGLKICLLFSIFLFVSIYDAMTHRIPRFVHIVIIAIGFIGVDTNWVISQALPGFFIPSIPIFFLNQLLKQQIGLGDIKLMATGGFVVGLQNGYLSCLVAATLALAIQGKHNKNKAFAFAPYLCLGYLIIPFFTIYT